MMFKYTAYTVSAVMSTIILSACGLGSITDDLKPRQAYEIYLTGTYSIFEECSDASTLEGRVLLAKTSVQIDHTVCDITKLEFISDPAGIQIQLTNCRSDGDVPPSAKITIETQENSTTYLHGWFTKPKRIYNCPIER